MLARHIHQFFTDEDRSSSSLHLVNPSRAPPAGPTGDAQVTPAADEGRGRVSVPEGCVTSPSRHLHPAPPPPLHFYSILPVGQIGASPRQQGRADPSAVGRTDAAVPETRRPRPLLPWRPKVRGYLVPSDPSSSRSRLSEQSGELSDGPTHLFTLLSTGQQADSRYHGYPRARAAQVEPSVSPGDLFVEVGQLFVSHSHGASRRLFG